MPGIIETAILKQLLAHPDEFYSLYFRNPGAVAAAKTLTKRGLITMDRPQRGMNYKLRLKLGPRST